MGVLALKLLLAPSFVVGASLTARRFGPRVGGLVGGLPVVAGPILLVIAITHGRTFGSGAAGASLLGLVSLAAFVLAYGLLCRHVAWPLALPLGWLTFLAMTFAQAGLHPSPAVALVLAFAMFAVALAVLPEHHGGPRTTPPPRWDLPVRAVCAAAMVAALTGASSALGPHMSGLLAPFPIITSVLAAFTHAQAGPGDALRLLRGMLAGFFAFALFCFVAAVALPPAGVGGAFALATVVALGTQGALLGGEVVRSRA